MHMITIEKALERSYEYTRFWVDPIRKANQKLQFTENTIIVTMNQIQTWITKSLNFHEIIQQTRLLYGWMDKASCDPYSPIKLITFQR